MEVAKGSEVEVLNRAMLLTVLLMYRVSFKEDRTLVIQILISSQANSSFRIYKTINNLTEKEPTSLLQEIRNSEI